MNYRSGEEALQIKSLNRCAENAHDDNLAEINLRNGEKSIEISFSTSSIVVEKLILLTVTITLVKLDFLQLFSYSCSCCLLDSVQLLPFDIMPK